MSTEIQKQNIVNYFQSLGEDYWKTVDEIATGANVPSSAVTSILANSGEFVRSSYRQRAGEPLFTSRLNFREKAPFMDKIIGAFKNRID